jgi:hypothetical protein
MTQTTSRTKSDQMIDIARLYVDAGGEEPIDLEKLAAFAINNGHWDRRNLGALRLQLCKREFSRAFREQHHRDAQGRDVRTFHATHARGENGGQKTLWGDLRKADEEHMGSAFQQRRAQIVGDCCQLKTDVDSYNDNNAHGGSFQLVLDFTDDADERAQSTSYRPRQPK